MKDGSRKVFAGVVIMATLGLGGCGAGPEAPDPATPTDAPLPSAEASRSTPPMEAKSGAEKVAISALSAFVNHKRPQDQWWSDFAQYLSPEALYVWEGVRADRVSASAITGAPTTTIVDGTFATVLLPTDAGTYRLDMSRRVSPESPDGVWLVFEMVPPGQSQ